MSDPGSVALPRLAVVGCVHGSLNQIYQDVQRMCDERGWETVDAVIMGGDFQAIRNSNDATCISVPAKYKQAGDFHEYYDGEKIAPFLTIFCGGNHEASNYLFELYYGGWVAPNIFYLGAAGVVRLGSIRIAGMSGIWKGYDYRKPHFERLPYSHDELHTAYHVRELDVRKLLQIRTQVDIGLSHDWPRAIEGFGDTDSLFRKKKGFREDSMHGRLGNVAAREVLDRLRPAYWFSAHLHVFFAATMPHADASLRKVHPSANEPAAWAAQLGPSPPPATPGKVKAGDGHVSARPSPPEKTSSPDATAKGSGGVSWYSSPEPRTADWSTPKTSDDTAWYSSPGPVVPPQPRPADRVSRPTFTRNTDAQQQISAWNTFSVQARMTEQEAVELFCRTHLPKRAEPEPPKGPATITSTWKPVKYNKDGERILDDKVVEEIPLDTKQKSAIKNADEISLGSSGSSSGGSPPRAIKRVATDGAWDPSAVNEPTQEPVALETARSKLPGSLARPAGSAKKAQKHIPDAISNKLTKFLALDKPNNHDAHIQLVEVTPVSSQDGIEHQRPFRLQYDKEWLAITRVFAEDLILGDPTAPVPSDLGEERYLPLIVESEKWVEDNIVKRGLLDIPHDFQRTAPKYDSWVPITTTEPPVEYNNPQTAAFCELLQIPNKFHLTDEERDARMEAGPRPSTQGAGRPRHRGRGGRRNNRGKRASEKW